MNPIVETMARAIAEYIGDASASDEMAKAAYDAIIASGYVIVPGG
jgi:hypothetical protein